MRASLDVVRFRWASMDGLLWVNHEWVNRPLTVAELSTEEVVTERAAEAAN